ncbi:uncharacterized protein LOC124293838 [Neodiprion lecontei]|uniref:Uncharacterized protein LOC124293838 n=1 Tax=Neodiprion lecontei TaxID=441921 RepID=A0ABM3FWD8_NEOLC|nr:uncharacterized protein LOC124293838 [Neodiprion lecontei]
MTIKNTMVLKCHLVFLIVNKLFATGEWVELPQFSDETKVYKLAGNRHDTLYNKVSSNDYKTVSDNNFAIANALNDFGNTDGNIAKVIISHDSKDPEHHSELIATNPSNFSNQSSLHIYTNDDRNDDSVDTFTQNVDIISSVKDVVHSNVVTSTPMEHLTVESPTEILDDPTTAIPILQFPTTGKPYSDKMSCNNQTLEDYLPMEMLRKVHQTLKSQPSTMKGKIRFLKQFEKDLRAEIEARLVAALAPPRRTRGAHDYWDNDEEIGFPSVEGALIAISFLTFAVYLVQLVMLLFRNTNNTVNGATIFFGRNRRSTVDSLTNKTDEILYYLDTFNTE